MLTQKQRVLGIETALGDEALVLRSISLQEPISRLFTIEAELRSEKGEIDFDEILGKNVTVRFELGENGTRYFNGFVSRFVQISNTGEFASYRAEIVPWLWFLTRAADCRIFQNKSVPDIIEEVFKAHGFSDYELKLSGSFPPWEFCVQYRETDFNFVSRLMEEEGIYYFFTHENGKHTMVLANGSSAHVAAEGFDEIAFQELDKGGSGQDVITDWTVQKEVQPGSYSLNDYSFEKPKTSLRTSANKSRPYGGANFEIYDYPGEYETPAEGERLAQVRLDEYQSQYEVLRGASSTPGITTGCKFKMKGHPRADQNRDYLITSVSLHADAGEYASGGGGEEFFTCQFTAIPFDQTYRAPRITPKPMIQGPQTAVVTGPKGEEIHVDKYGRVKVQFHWDRYGKLDENSSCFIRVSQIWAGKNWGAIYTPRIGQEVIVEFLEGDPDRPIITGRVYNDSVMPPYALPDKKNVSTLKSNSTKGGSGFNEIRLDDTKGKEQIFIHAEKNQDIRVKSDALEFIGNERHLIVKKDQLESVEGDKHGAVKGDHLTKVEGDRGATIGGDRMIKVSGGNSVTVGGDQMEKVGGDQHLKASNINSEASQKISLKAGTDIAEKAGMNYAVDAGMAVHIKAGMTVVIEAGVQLSLKVGGNFIDINPGGVFITGTLVMINSGGAAGSGGGCSPTAPAAPQSPGDPKKPKEADDAKPGEKTENAAATPYEKKKAEVKAVAVEPSPAAAVLKQAAEDGTPFCEECERARKEREQQEKENAGG